MSENSGSPATEAQAKQLWQKILDTVVAVITKPAEFFRGMPKTGGFGDPLIFMIVMGVVAGLVRAVLGLVHLGAVLSVGMALASIVLTPILVAILGFVGAGILFLIWKLMGSQESYETSYRCMAYMSAISPITALLQAVPFVGALAGLAWGLWLVVLASVEVHKIKAQTAWLVWGILTAILALFAVGGQIAARKASRAVQEWQKQYGGKPGEEMTPEQAGRAAAAFMKAFEEQAQKEAAKTEGEGETAEAEE
jgi:hypothetical protein